MDSAEAESRAVPPPLLSAEAESLLQAQVWYQLQSRNAAGIENEVFVVGLNVVCNDEISEWLSPLHVLCNMLPAGKGYMEIYIHTHMFIWET